jgi:prepilin-type N-terminal cleavage/methylation domain-containing protein
MLGEYFSSSNTMKKIQHSPLNIKNYPGFTLVELLAVISVFVIVGMVTTGIFLSSFRATTKSDSLALLRQNGDFAMSQIEKQLRFATSLNGLSNDTQIPPTTLNACTDLTGGSMTQYKQMQIANADGGTSTYSCTTGSGGNVASNSANFLDPKVVTDVDACYFTCAKGTLYSAPVITFYLTLAQRYGNASAAESHSTLNFQTSVTLRNATQQTK